MARIQSEGPDRDDAEPTSFVSQVLWWGGGYPMAGFGGSKTDDHNWWEQAYQGTFIYTRSWSTARYHYNFQIHHSPGGSLRGTAPGRTASSYSGNAVGDLFFYDWTSNGSIDHVNIMVGHGTDPNSGWIGDYVDQHTTNRRHAFWSLWPYNSDASTTTIYIMRIYSSN